MNSELNVLLNLIGDFIGRVGFPVFVAVYVMVRMETALNRLSDHVRLQSILLARQQGVSLEDIERTFGNGRR